ncbi:RagB/SusD family nutrient uptake outer membrane protein [Emticicia sp. 17c]|uniref:RagB/SusD family nutrient uptake outer membrane protein n=1 Tax=Emticicia sp. 17c TaxID=3127704 RepID=UPI00301BA085
MKRYIAIIFIGMLLAACSNNLNLKPLSQNSVANYYQSASDIEVGVNGAYQALQLIGQYGQDNVFLMEVRSDNSEESDLGASGAIFSDLDTFKERPTNSVLAESWRDNFIGIQRCNIILNRIDGVSMDANIKNIRKGEMQFLRALMYFNLVRIFGDVPLVLNETTDPNESFSQGRSSATDVYTQIVSDLNSAANLLPVTQSQIGKATKGAANALLGKVYLTLKRYSEAEQTLRKITGYRLISSYANVFGVSNKNNAESIFEVQYKKGNGSTIIANGLGDGLGQGSAYANLFAPQGGNSLLGPSGGQALGSNRPTLDLINSFEQGDLRKDATIGILNDRAYPAKYLDKPNKVFDSDLNFIVLRYADVMLMLAEALNEQAYNATGEAFSLINQIRQRAGLNILTSITTPNQDSFRLALENERRHELAFEGHRWFDLLRTNRALTVMQKHVTNSGGVQIALSSIKAFQLLYPVPQTEIDTNPNKILQNPGY